MMEKHPEIQGLSGGVTLPGGDTLHWSHSHHGFSHSNPTGFPLSCIRTVEPALMEGTWASSSLILYRPKQGEHRSPPQYQPQQPPHTMSSILKLLSGALMDGPRPQWMHPSAHSLRSFQGRLQLHFPASPLFIAWRNLGRVMEGGDRVVTATILCPRGQHSLAAAPGLWVLLGFLWVEMALLQAEKGRTKKKALWQVP